MLRKASLNDFEEFKLIYADIEFQCLYNPKNLPKEPDEKFLKEILQWDGKEYDEEYTLYSVDLFEEDLDNIFLWEEKQTVAGFFMLTKEKNCWRICEWGAFNDDIKEKMLVALFSLCKSKKIKAIKVFPVLYDEDRLLLKKYDFKGKSCLWKKEV